MSSPDLRCYCGSRAALRRGPHGPFWGCSWWPSCDGKVGCHPGTTRPLGTLVDKPTQQARIRAHKAFDALWQPIGKRYRGLAYQMLAAELGRDEAHIGEMSAEECEVVIEWASGMGPDNLVGYRAVAREEIERASDRQQDPPPSDTRPTPPTEEMPR